ncbi:glycosyltransferase [Tepidibacter sp. Z1-5]|uniref:glycosyltransferase n=1 Tax=Tepidibacter sp. Z1-5 TaxID=3134138 RepID=UPI0030C41FF8
MNISLCMIVKDEEMNLKKCLQSVVSFVDEIIIVDTGSTDKTKDIAKDFTEKIYDFDWCNDFAKARNFSLEKANNDWILVLDADEVVADFKKKELAKYIGGNDRTVGRIKRINIFEDNIGSKRYIERVNRVFNKKHYHYEGIIHEQIISKNKQNYKIINVDIIADHIGYTKEVIKNTDKINRNLKLLKESIKKNDKDPYLYYQLGKTYYMDKRYEDAYGNFVKALNLDIDTKYEYVQDLVESYGHALINTERYKKALELETYDYFYKEIIDYKFLMGLIYMNNGLFEKSVNSFISCIGDKEGKIEGLNSYLAYYNIGVIYECLGFIEEGIYYYQKCENYEPAKKRIDNLK